MSSDVTNASRRKFLKRGASAIAGTALVANITSFSQRVHAAGSDVLAIGLVGCGGRGTSAAVDALSADPHTELVAIGDAFAGRADDCLKVLQTTEEVASRVRVDNDRVFVGLDAYKYVIENADVVLLCSPPGFRPQHFAAAVAAGKHVFAEKPMATDSTGVRSIMASVQESKEKNLAVVAGFIWRYNYAKRALFNKIHSGAVGDVRSVHGTYLTVPVRPMPPAETRPNDMSDLEWMVSNWYNFAWLSGDGLVEQACHAADWIAWAFDDAPPVSCTAVGGRQIPAEGGDIFDHIEVNYLWENGARGSLAQRQMVGCMNENHLYVLGTTGNASITRHDQISDLSDNRVWRYDGPDDNMYRIEHRELFASIRAGKPINDGDRMASSTLMSIMGRMAGYSGQEITWEMALNSEESLAPDLTLGWNSPVTFRSVPLPGTNVHV